MDYNRPFRIRVIEEQTKNGYQYSFRYVYSDTGTPDDVGCRFGIMADDPVELNEMVIDAYETNEISDEIFEDLVDALRDDFVTL